jgi:hypothetical protein
LLVSALATLVPLSCRASTITGMTSLLDPLPDEGQQLVDLVAQAYAMAGRWPVWQYVAQHAHGKYGIDAEAALRNLPQWPGTGVSGYQAMRTVPAAAGNSSPDIEARTVLTVHGLFHVNRDEEHPLLHAFRQAVEIGAQRQGGATLSPYKATPIILDGEHLVDVVNHRVSTNLKAAELGLLLSGEPLTTGGGVRETDGWTWDLTRHRPLRRFVSADARELLVKLDGLLGSQTERPYVPLSPDALPRALDHLNVVWKALSQQRLFYPRGLAAAASLVEPVRSGDELTARLGALADIFDLFMRTSDGKAPKGGSLNVFREELVTILPSVPEQAQAEAAVSRLGDINRIRNGRLHTDATNWAESLQRIGIASSELPGQQWDRVRTAAVDAIYVLIELLQPLIA